MLDILVSLLLPHLPELLGVVLTAIIGGIFATLSVLLTGLFTVVGIYYGKKIQKEATGEDRIYAKRESMRKEQITEVADYILAANNLGKEASGLLISYGMNISPQEMNTMDTFNRYWDKTAPAYNRSLVRVNLLIQNPRILKAVRDFEAVREEYGVLLGEIININDINERLGKAMPNTEIFKQKFLGCVQAIEKIAIEELISENKYEST